MGVPVGLEGAWGTAAMGDGNRAGAHMPDSARTRVSRVSDSEGMFAQIDLESDSTYL